MHLQLLYLYLECQRVCIYSCYIYILSAKGHIADGSNLGLFSFGSVS
jgi:hypothetical protein